MFNRKKREIVYLKTMLEGNKKVIVDLKKENAALVEANGNLYRDLNQEIRQKQELSDQLIERDRELKNLAWRESHFKAGHKTEPRPICPDDCTHRANPGPGASICRNCIRNPRAVDKYEVAE